MWLGLAVESLPFTFCMQFFFMLLGAASGTSFNELTFTPFGFFVLYFAAFATLWSLRD